MEEALRAELAALRDENVALKARNAALELAAQRHQPLPPANADASASTSTSAAAGSPGASGTRARPTRASAARRPGRSQLLAPRVLLLLPRDAPAPLAGAGLQLLASVARGDVGRACNAANPAASRPHCSRSNNTLSPRECLIIKGDTILVARPHSVSLQHLACGGDESRETTSAPVNSPRPDQCLSLVKDGEAAPYAHRR